MPRNGLYKDLTGMRFGMLLVIERAGEATNGSTTTPTWKVRCNCGREKAVRGPSLRAGRTTSCGCQKRRHGMFGTPEYTAWTAIIDRCTNQKSNHFQGYGGRGIKVCERWRGSFEAFFLDMGPRPSSNHSIDRINNEGNYEPGNCRWATATEQGRNKRNNHVLTVGGLSGTISEWAERTGIGKTTIKERLRRGWSPERAVQVTT